MAGRLKVRSGPQEKTWRRMLREAGGRVRDNVFLRDLAISSIDPAYHRQIEIVVTGLPFAHGLPVAVDATMLSVLHADGSPWAGAETKPGSSFGRAYRDKFRTYPELKDSDTVRLVVAGAEVGGRMTRESLDLLDAAANSRSQLDPPVLRRQAARAWRARWLAMLAVSAQDTLAATLIRRALAWWTRRREQRPRRPRCGSMASSEAG